MHFAVPSPLLSSVDHLLYATADLEGTVDALAEQLGLMPSAGGAHPGRGTRNALLALGPSSYLEIVGPDREQPEPAARRWFDIDTLSAPKLVTWAAKGTGLTALRAKSIAAGVALGDIASGSRQRPDGSMLAQHLCAHRSMWLAFHSTCATPHRPHSSRRSTDRAGRSLFAERLVHATDIPFTSWFL